MYPRFFPILQSCANPLGSFRSCQMASRAGTPAALASSGIFP